MTLQQLTLQALALTVSSLRSSEVNCRAHCAAAFPTPDFEALVSSGFGGVGHQPAPLGGRSQKASQISLDVVSSKNDKKIEKKEQEKNHQFKHFAEFLNTFQLRMFVSVEVFVSKHVGISFPYFPLTT